MTGRYEDTFHELHGEVLYEERVEGREVLRTGLKGYGLTAAAGASVLVVTALVSDGGIREAAVALLAGAGAALAVSGLLLASDVAAASRNLFCLRSDGLEVRAPMSPHPAETGPGVVEHGQIPYASMLWVGPLRVGSRLRVQQQLGVIAQQGTMPAVFQLRERWLVVYRGHDLTHAFVFQPSAVFAARLVKELKDRGCGAAVQHLGATDAGQGTGTSSS